MNTFNLSRNFWNWAFDNPELIKPNHAAIYFFAVEHQNRLGGKEKFGFPSQMTMDAIGINKHQTYIKYFNQLVEFGFFKLVQKSSNQYSANIISLPSALPKKDKALDKAFIKHRAKQTESMGQSTYESEGYIDKQVYKETKKPINKETKTPPDFEEFKSYALEKDSSIDSTDLKLKYEAWIENGWKDGHDKSIKNWKSKLLQTIPYLKKINGKDNNRNGKKHLTGTEDFFEGA